MRYVSTRGAASAKTFCDCLLEGLAEDGGLYMPESYPSVSDADLGAWGSLDYPSLALAIIGRFAPEIPTAELRAILQRTYTAERFGSAEITPISTLEPRLHCSNSRTARRSRSRISRCSFWPG